jgi:hypothetical protein
VRPTVNLKHVPDYLKEFTSLGDEGQGTVRGRVTELLGAIEVAPKTLAWKMRAKIGTRSRCYQEVSEKSEQY